MQPNYQGQGFTPEVPKDKESSEKKVGRLFLSIVILIAIIGGSIAVAPIIICLFLLVWPIVIPLVILAGIVIYKILGKISKI